MSLQAFGLSSKNPVLKNITDYLIEEASAEEEELLGMSGDQEEGQLGDGDSSIERDPVLIKVNLINLKLLLQYILEYDFNGLFRDGSISRQAHARNVL